MKKLILSILIVCISISTILLITPSASTSEKGICCASLCLHPCGTSGVTIQVATDPNFNNIVHSCVTGSNGCCEFCAEDKSITYYARAVCAGIPSSSVSFDVCTPSRVQVPCCP